MYQGLSELREEPENETLKSVQTLCCGPGYISWFVVFPPLFFCLQCLPVSVITFCVSDVIAVLVFCLLITSCFSLKVCVFLFCFYYSFISDVGLFFSLPPSGDSPVSCSAISQQCTQSDMFHHVCLFFLVLPVLHL